MLMLPLKVSPKAEQGAFYSPISSTTSSSVAAALKAFHERNRFTLHHADDRQDPK